MGVMDLPAMLKVEGRKAVVVGGGGVAARRVRSLLETGARVLVVAPAIDPAIEALAANGRTQAGGPATLTLERRGFDPADLAGAMLAVIATSDAAVNERAATEARRRGVLVNRADAPAESDFVVPAHRTLGPVTLSVSTDGISAAAAAEIADELAGQMSPEWPAVLAAARPRRAELQARLADEADRRRLLRRLTDDEARRVYRESGPDALRAHLERIVEQADNAPNRAPRRPANGPGDRR